MIKQAVTSQASDDSSAYPNIKISYNGKVSTATRMSPYGLCANPPQGSMSLVFNVQGQESNKFCISDDMLGRLKDLKEGESALFNSLTGSFVKMAESGAIEAQGTDISLTGTGTITLLAPNIVFAGSITGASGGALNIASDIDVDGDISPTGTVDGVDISTHTHSDPQGGNTGPPN